MDRIDKNRLTFGAGGHYEVRVPNARRRVEAVIDTLFFERGREDGGELDAEDTYFEADRPPVWLPEYDEVCDWLTDNKGQGLLMAGAYGTGKTMFARTVIPTIISNRYGKEMTFCDARELNDRRDEVLARRMLVVDDLGAEDAVGNDYGTRYLLFPQVVDGMAKRGGLLVVTSNLSVGELQSKYGFRTWDRLAKLTRYVGFGGQSLRTCRTWDDLTAEEWEAWKRRGAEYTERRARVMARYNGDDAAAAYRKALEAWYGEMAKECGMETADWLEWKTADKDYLRGLWERDRAEGRSFNFFWWLKAKDLWRDEFAEGEPIADTAVKGIKTPQISTIIRGVV